MPSKFKSANNDWTEFRQLPELVEVDFHWANQGKFHDYRESMDAVYDIAIKSLVKAQKEGKQNVLFTHGSSTS